MWEGSTELLLCQYNYLWVIIRMMGRSGLFEWRWLGMQYGACGDGWLGLGFSRSGVGLDGPLNGDLVGWDFNAEGTENAEAWERIGSCLCAIGRDEERQRNGSEDPPLQRRYKGGTKALRVESCGVGWARIAA